MTILRKTPLLNTTTFLFHFLYLNVFILPFLIYINLNHNNINSKQWTIKSQNVIHALTQIKNMLLLSRFIYKIFYICFLHLKYTLKSNLQSLENQNNEVKLKQKLNRSENYSKYKYEVYKTFVKKGKTKQYVFKKLLHVIESTR